MARKSGKTRALAASLVLAGAAIFGSAASAQYHARATRIARQAASVSAECSHQMGRRGATRNLRGLRRGWSPAIIACTAICAATSIDYESRQAAKPEPSSGEFRTPMRMVHRNFVQPSVVNTAVSGELLAIARRAGLNLAVATRQTGVLYAPPEAHRTRRVNMPNGRQESARHLCRFDPARGFAGRGARDREKAAAAAAAAEPDPMGRLHALGAGHLWRRLLRLSRIDRAVRRPAFRPRHPSRGRLGGVAEAISPPARFGARLRPRPCRPRKKRGE